MNLTRENVKICDELVAQLEGDSEQDTNSLLGALNLLSALRASSEVEIQTPAPRTANNAKAGRNNKRKGDTASVMSDDRESAAAESPAAPSPKVHIPVPSRLKVNTNASSRAGSVGAGREASVKIEEGTESGIDAKRIGDPFLLASQHDHRARDFHTSILHCAARDTQETKKTSIFKFNFSIVKKSDIRVIQLRHSTDRDFKSEPKSFTGKRASAKPLIQTKARECSARLHL